MSVSCVTECRDVYHTQHLGSLVGLGGEHLDHEDNEDYVPDRLTTYNRFEAFNFTAGNNYQHRLEFVFDDQFINDFAQQQRQYLFDDNDLLESPQGPTQQGLSPSNLIGLSSGIMLVTISCSGATTKEKV